MTRSQRRVLARSVIVAIVVLVAYWGAGRLWPKSKPPLPEPSAKVVRPAATAPGARSRTRPWDPPSGAKDRAKAKARAQLEALANSIPAQGSRRVSLNSYRDNVSTQSG